MNCNNWHIASWMHGHGWIVCFMSSFTVKCSKVFCLCITFKVLLLDFLGLLLDLDPYMNQWINVCWYANGADIQLLNSQWLNAFLNVDFSRNANRLEKQISIRVCLTLEFIQYFAEKYTVQVQSVNKAKIRWNKW